MNTNNMIDKDELILAAANVESIKSIIALITEDFFDKYNPKTDSYAILYDFKRIRAYANILLVLINIIDKTLKDNNITAYSE